MARKKVNQSTQTFQTFEKSSKGGGVMNKLPEELRKVLEELNSSPVSMPARLIKVSYDPEFHYGEWVLMNDNPEPLGKTIKFVPIKEFGRYTRFNPTLGRADIVSNFFELKDSRKAIDKFSKKLISELRNEFQDIKFGLYFFGYLLRDDKAERVVITFKGSSLNSFIEVQRNELNKLRVWRGVVKFIMTSEKQKRPNTPIVFFVPSIKVEQLTEQELLLIAKDLPTYIEDIKSYVNYSNGGEVGGASQQDVSEEDFEIEL